jgi:hypothetical protein
MLKFFKYPFAVSGDKTAVPDAIQVTGEVSYQEGYGFDYQRDASSDPLAKNIERDKMNQVLYDMTAAVSELQSGPADFITSALNGGSSYSYSLGAVVKYSGRVYESLKNANTDLPSVAASWSPVDVQGMQTSAIIVASAAGTADAITGAFTPAITSLTNGMTLFVRAGAANTVTNPTFKADGTAAKTIVKGANSALVAGDIAGAGHWIELQYDATFDRFEIKNPATGVTGGVTFASNAEAQALSSTTKAISPATLAAAFQGANQSLTTKGSQKLPGGLIINWGQIAISAGTNAVAISDTFDEPFTTAVFSVSATVNHAAPGLCFACLDSSSLSGFSGFVAERSATSYGAGVVYYYAVGK